MSRRRWTHSKYGRPCGSKAVDMGFNACTGVSV
jgi:hypothetical protein